MAGETPTTATSVARPPGCGKEAASAGSVSVSAAALEWAAASGFLLERLMGMVRLQVLVQVKRQSRVRDSSRTSAAVR
jgi:hypothetical protein